MMKRFGILPVAGAAVLAAFMLGAPAASRTAQAADIVGRGSIGGNVGGMKFLTGHEFKHGQPRFLFQAVFKYNFTDHLAGVVESGWGWNAYDVRLVGDGIAVDTTFLATVVPTTFGIEYRTNAGGGPIWTHFGAGAGFYSLGVKDSFRTWARADSSRERLTWTSPGLYGKIGAEYLFQNAASINVDFLYHTIFSKNADRFPEWWGNQNTSFAEFRIGANYYFTLKRQGPAPDEGGGSD